MLIWSVTGALGWIVGKKLSDTQKIIINFICCRCVCECVCVSGYVIRPIQEDTHRRPFYAMIWLFFSHLLHAFYWVTPFNTIIITTSIEISKNWTSRNEKNSIFIRTLLSFGNENLSSNDPKYSCFFFLQPIPIHSRFLVSCSLFYDHLIDALLTDRQCQWKFIYFHVFLFLHPFSFWIDRNNSNSQLK